MPALEALLTTLPSVSEPPSLVDPAPNGIRYVTSERAEFVDPPLTILDGRLEQAQVVVVSAPAAVGKSMLAEYLAYRTADALDEARLRVSFDAFAAFLDDLTRQLVAPAVAGRPALVLLARGEPAEFAAEWLGESGTEVAAVGIEFFDRPKALAFVDKQIAARDKDPSQEAMINARDAMFHQTLTLLGVEEDEWPLDPAGRFLGYAPVLVALGRHLAEGGNPQRLAVQMAAESTPETMWRFLVALVRDILEREQGKFVEGFRGGAGGRATAAGLSSWDSVFTPREQCSWLLNEALDGPAPPVPVPRELEDDYRSEVRSWLTNHVLAGASRGSFASPVFEEFVYAQILADGTPAEAAVVRAQLAGASYRPTEMLARFVFALSEGPPTVPSADLTAIYESLSAGEEAGRAAELELTDDDGLRAGIVIRGERIDFELTSSDELLVFTRRLGRASIMLERHGVRLGASGRPFEIGPDVSIRATVIEVAAESLLVRGGGHPSADVVLAAQAVDATDPAFRRLVDADQRLKVRAVQPPRYPFADKQIAPGPEGPLGPDEERAANAMFRLMAFFKSEGYGGLGSYAEPIDRKAARDETFGQILSFAQTRGLVTGEGRLYKLHPETIDLDYLSVQAQVLSEEAKTFILDFTSGQRD